MSNNNNNNNNNNTVNNSTTTKKPYLVMNVAQASVESYVNQDLPLIHQGRMIVEMKPNTMQVPSYCFTLSYKYPELKEIEAPENKKIKVTQESTDEVSCDSSKHEKTVVYKERAQDLARPPVLSNKVLSGILRNVRNAYRNFKINLVHANSWMFGYDHTQDIFFEKKLLDAADKIKNCPYQNVSLWSAHNMHKFCLEDDDLDLTNMIIAIHMNRVIGFTAETDHKNKKVKVLVFHQARTEVHEYAHDCDFFAYGYPKDEIDNNDENESDY